MSTLPLRAFPSPLRRGTRRRRASAPGAAPGSGRCAWSSRTRRRCRERAGSTSTRCCRASAARTCPPWTGAARAISRTSSRFPSSPATRWWATCPPTPSARTGQSLAAGTRVVLQPVLGCAARGIDPLCPACEAGHVGNCGHLAFGHIRPGLQTGFCADTGGGWSTTGLVAHSSQLFAVPDGLSDADAVTTEPVACAVHAVLGAGHPRGGRGRRASGPARSGSRSPPRWPTWPPPAAARRPAPCWSAPSTPTSNAWPASSAPPRPSRPTNWRGPCAGTATRCPSAARPARRPRFPAEPTW